MWACKWGLWRVYRSKGINTRILVNQRSRAFYGPCRGWRLFTAFRRAASRRGPAWLPAVNGYSFSHWQTGSLPDLVPSDFPVCAPAGASLVHPPPLVAIIIRFRTPFPKILLTKTSFQNVNTFYNHSIGNIGDIRVSYTVGYVYKNLCSFKISFIYSLFYSSGYKEQRILNKKYERKNRPL